MTVVFSNDEELRWEDINCWKQIGSRCRSNCVKLGRFKFVYWCKCPLGFAGKSIVLEVRHVSFWTLTFFKSNLYKAHGIDFEHLLMWSKNTVLLQLEVFLSYPIQLQSEGTAFNDQPRQVHFWIIKHYEDGLRRWIIIEWHELVCQWT